MVFRRAEKLYVICLNGRDESNSHHGLGQETAYLPAEVKPWGCSGFYASCICFILIVTSYTVGKNVLYNKKDFFDG